MPILLRGVALAVLLLLVARPGRVRADGFALELDFGEGVTPCFAQDELMHAVIDRLAHTASSNRPNQSGLSIRAHVDQNAQQGLHAIITSRRNDGADEGRREIVAEGGCAALLKPLSLVIALVVDLAAPDPEPAADAAPATTAVPNARPETPETPALAADAQAGAAAQPALSQAKDDPHAGPARIAEAASARPATGLSTHARRLGMFNSRNALNASAGVGVGILPEVIDVLHVAARFALTLPARDDEHVPIVSELGADLLVPQRLSQRPISIDGVAWHAAGCAFWHHALGRVGLEPCAGLWLRVLSASWQGSPPAAVDGRQFMLVGFSLGLSVYVPLSGRWSVFTSGQAQTPFARPTLMLKSHSLNALAPRLGMPPFFNQPVTSGHQATVSDPATNRLELFETPPVGATLLAGIALNL